MVGGMTQTKTATLRVPGAHVHYQVRGSGPVLLIVMGGSGDADAADGLARHLGDRYSVVTYDRRGLSRSTLDDPEEHPRIQTHSDDVHRLLAQVTAEPAFVLGTSLGALIALDLASRHPEQVRLLIAHEAPVRQLLPPTQRADAERVQRAIERGPRGPEWAEVMRKIAVNHADREPGVEIPTPTPQAIANSEFFRQRDAPAAHQYELDVYRLRAAATQIVAAGGEKSKHAFPYRSMRALAELLEIKFVEFPGDHAGFATRPEAFAAKLAAILTHDQRTVNPDR
jgi:pimeloyl-ACP methyl ester carboxylesterase